MEGLGLSATSGTKRNWVEVRPFALDEERVSVRVKRFRPRQEFVHTHPGTHCCILLRGSAVEWNGKSRIELEPGSVSVRASGTTHTVRFGDNAAVAVVVESGGPRYGQMLEIERPDTGAAASADLRGLAARFASQFPVYDDCDVLVVEGLALQLLGTLASARRASSTGRPPRWLMHVRRRLTDDPAAHISLSELAREVGVHPTHLTSQFRRWFRMSPGELVRRQRVEGACDLIRTTALSLAQIADATGFCDQSHFTKTFRRVTGLTPAAFRRAAP